MAGKTQEPESVRVTAIISGTASAIVAVVFAHPELLYLAALLIGFGIGLTAVPKLPVSIRGDASASIDSVAIFGLGMSTLVGLLSVLHGTQVFATTTAIGVFGLLTGMFVRYVRKRAPT
jgi:uncharacterized membrane protein YedE/YeeE